MKNRRSKHVSTGQEAEEQKMPLAEVGTENVNLSVEPEPELKAEAEAEAAEVKPKKPSPVLGDSFDEKVMDWMKKVRFKKAVFGVDEADVWKKISELNAMYEAAITAERVRYDTLIREIVLRGAVGREPESEQQKAGDD